MFCLAEIRAALPAAAPAPAPALVAPRRIDFPENESDIDVVLSESQECLHLPNSAAFRARSQVGIVAARDKPDMNNNHDDDDDDDEDDDDDLRK